MSTMSLSAPDRKLKIDIPVCGRTLDLLAVQLAKIRDEAELTAFASRVATRVDDAIAQSVEKGLRSPARAQVAVATRIASELGITLTADVLRYQEAMDAFLASHVSKLKK